MAEIHRARLLSAPDSAEPLVIKRILPALARDRALTEMFVNEARLAMGLSHPNIAQVFDFGEVAGEYFLAMELVQGESLQRVLRRAQKLDLPDLPMPFAVSIAIELCKGLHYAHTRRDDAGRMLGLVHRDVSPENVMLSYAGAVKLVDFGIAKTALAGGSKTKTGAVKGKYLFFSPEQAQGQPLDARSDVFSAGVVLYTLLCGRQPFLGKHFPAMRAIVQGEFPLPRTLNANISPALEHILLTALAKDRDQRFASAQAFEDALSRILVQEAPGLPSNALQSLMHFLFEPEMIAQGLAVRRSSALLSQVPRWRKRESGSEWSAVRADVLRQPGRRGRASDAAALTVPMTSGTRMPSPRASDTPPHGWQLLFVLIPFAVTLGSGALVYGVASLMGKVHRPVRAPTSVPGQQESPPPEDGGWQR